MSQQQQQQQQPCGNRNSTIALFFVGVSLEAKCLCRSPRKSCSIYPSIHDGFGVATSYYTSSSTVLKTCRHHHRTN
jgi:hypothetical protein